MAPQNPSPTSPASGPSAAMFHKSPGGNIESSELCNSARDMFKIVFNYYSSNRSGTGQAARTGKEVENDVIDYLLNILPLLLKEVGKNQSWSSVSKTSGADGSGLLPQGVTTDHTPQSPIVEGYSVDMNDTMPSESSSLPVSSIADRYIQSTQITPHAPQSSKLEGDLAQVSNLVPSDPSSLPVTCIADRYARSMLKCLHGYPLYEPEPFSELSKEYLRNGVHIGDVGFGGLINPPDLSDDFYLETPNHSATRPVRPHPRKTYIFESPITRTNSGKYSCEKSEGAILELPEGAIEHEAINIGPFQKLAARHGVQWYNYTMNRGREIPNGSLYLITSFTKCTQWGIAMFNQPCTPGQGLRFGSKASFPFCRPNPKYHWRGSGAFTARVAKPNQTDTPNQCVFLRGYKIMIRQDIFDNLCNRSGTTTPSLPPQTGSSNPKRRPAQRIRGGGGTDFISRILTRTPTKMSNVTQLDEVVLHANFNSSLVHPSDLINAALLSQNPSAQVALTHDDVWCDLLRDDFPKPNHETLINSARLYSSTVDEYGCVSLEKISDPSNDESCSVQGIGALHIQPKRSSTSDEKYIPVPDETSMSIDQEKNNMYCAIVYKIYGDIVIFEFGDGHYTEQERSMIRDHLSNTVAFKLMDNNDVVKTMKKHFLAQSILNLPNPQAACSDDQIKKKHVLCSNGTRVPLLQEMADWVTGTDETRIYVLSGLARIGKTTVALTIATRADDLGLLGASFFFSRDEDNRANAKMFFTAIAYQLCRYSEPLAKAIEVALLTKPDPDTMDPQEQLDALLLEPLWSIVRRRIRPILIVVDGLDECGEEDGLLILIGLSQLVRELLSFKVILTARPQPRLDRFIHSQDGHKVFHLHDMKDRVVNVDTGLYIEHSLSQKSIREQLQEPPETSSTLVGPLVRQAAEMLFSRVEAPSITFSSGYGINNLGSSSFQDVQFPHGDANIAILDDQVRLHEPDQGPVPPPSISADSAEFQGSQGLESMKKYVSFAALYNSSAQDPDRRCHPGTRKTALSRLQHWISNTNTTEPILWMNGPAGVGKTAIAQTIACSFGRDKVAATFFFYRSDPKRNNGNRLFTTLAWQLAFSMPPLKSYIANSLQNRPDIPMKDIETQFEELIVRPFQFLDVAATPKLAPVIIIDGIDECTDERLQQRFLKVIGNAVNNHHVPLRFLISSRPEVHIQETIDQFECPVHLIDLAGLDDAHHDIEKYLKAEFSRIASEQGLYETWPGQERIQRFVDKSSGHFAYASTVIRYIDDPYNSAPTQLDIVLGLKPARTKSPFAELDELYLEILQRQPDQVFLIEFLKVLVARSVISVDDLHEDDAMLMEVSDKELRRKLRGMHSLLKFEPSIDVYHRSFLDFLQDSSRSGQYHISEQGATRQYLAQIVGSLLRYVSRVIEQPNYHEIDHFTPCFYRIARDYPPKMKLPVDDWQGILRPLVDFQDTLLNIPNFISTWELLPCDKCMVFHIIRHMLLHLAVLQGTSQPAAFSIRAAEPLSNIGEANTNTLSEAEQNVVAQDLDDCLSSLLIHLRDMKSELSVNAKLLEHLHTLLHFDCAESVKRIRAASDAQNLMDLIDFLNSNEYFLNRYGRNVARKAAQLELGIFARVAVLPRSLFLSDDVHPCHSWFYRIDAELEILCQSALMGRVLDHNYVVPLLRVYEESGHWWSVGSDVNETNESLTEWRKRIQPSASRRIQVMLEIAKAIQYFHSMGVIFHYGINLDDFFLDSEFRVKVHFRGTTSRCIQETPLSYHSFGNANVLYSDEANIFFFGCFFYEMYFDREISFGDRIAFKTTMFTEKPPEPKIREDAWQLIQRCCAKDPRSRPSIDEIVQEMETWKIS